MTQNGSIHPMISIITVTYNAEAILEETLLSIINQTNNNNIELIVVDGKSKDGTVDIIKKYESHISKWASEADKGIFDAMNKGLDLATGTWVNFMNAGDTFYSLEVLQNIDFQLYEKKNVGILYGNTCRSRTRITYPSLLEDVKTGGIPACHQSMFFNRNLLKDDLYIDEKYSSLSRYGDVELFAKLFHHGYKFEYVDIVVSDCILAGSSTNISWVTRYYKFSYILKYFGIINLIKSIFKYFNVCDYSSIRPDLHIEHKVK
jgi:glycosyltransferase involved in cell wall biosynthesis